ncbi:hypothetical protein V494_05795 [Pseudogymnoascus sp. VKM F-4513 (FW-928)]|nr:hypothetical protein V494_05795 [Pseudogymnoascus sp. VKM F-4513 (FW-928)]
MDSNKAKQGSKEKPTYDTALYLYVQSLETLRGASEELKLNSSSKSKTPTKSSTDAQPESPVKTSTISANNQSDYAASQQPQKDDEGKAMWTQAQEDYAYDYIRRLRERYADKPERITVLIDVLSRRHGIERSNVWLEVCRIMHDAPDLRDEFKTFMGAEDGQF